MTVFLAITIPILATIAYLAVGIRARHWVAPRAFAWRYEANRQWKFIQRDNAIDEGKFWIHATVPFWPVTIPIVWAGSRAGSRSSVDWEQYAPWAIKEREVEKQAELERRQQRIRQLEHELGIEQDDR